MIIGCILCLSPLMSAAQPYARMVLSCSLTHTPLLNCLKTFLENHFLALLS